MAYDNMGPNAQSPPVKIILKFEMNFTFDLTQDIFAFAFDSILNVCVRMFARARNELVEETS